MFAIGRGQFHSADVSSSLALEVFEDLYTMIISLHTIGMDMDIASRQKLLTIVDRNRDSSIEFLRKLVSIPSVTGEEAAVQNFLAEHLAAMGLAVDLWETDWEALKKHPGYRPVERGYEGRPNIVATLKGTGGGRSLLLNGHSDVIPVGKGEGWSVDPWSALIKDGRI
ncbi:MAG: hypothetical protein AB7S59_08895, partial [Parvibaculaceae bacterium]